MEFKLSNGLIIPEIGFGTWMIPNNLAKDAVIENIEKIIDRDNKMGIIVSKSDDLKILSMNINSIADNIRKNENSKKNRSIFFVTILVGLIIILFLLIS